MCLLLAGVRCRDVLFAPCRIRRKTIRKIRTSQCGTRRAGVDTLFYTVGVPYSQFQQHPKLTGVALKAAAASGVRRYVHVSTVYPYGVPQQEFVSESHPRNPTAFKGHMRKDQEDLVMAADNPQRDANAPLAATGFLRAGLGIEFRSRDLRRSVEGWDRQCHRSH